MANQQAGIGSGVTGGKLTVPCMQSGIDLEQSTAAAQAAIALMADTHSSSNDRGTYSESLWAATTYAVQCRHEQDKLHQTLKEANEHHERIVGALESKCDTMSKMSSVLYENYKDLQETYCQLRFDLDRALSSPSGSASIQNAIQEERACRESLDCELDQVKSQLAALQGTQVRERCRLDGEIQRLRETIDRKGVEIAGLVSELNTERGIYVNPEVLQRQDTDFSSFTPEIKGLRYDSTKPRDQFNVFLSEFESANFSIQTFQSTEEPMHGMAGNSEDLESSDPERADYDDMFAPMDTCRVS